MHRQILLIKISVIFVLVGASIRVDSRGYDWRNELVDSIGRFSSFEFFRDENDRVQVIGDRHGWSRVYPEGLVYENEHLAGFDSGYTIGTPVIDGNRWFAVGHSPTGAFDLIEYEHGEYLIHDISVPDSWIDVSDICITESGNIVICYRERVSGALMACLVDRTTTDVDHFAIDSDGDCGDSLQVLPYAENGFQVYYQIAYPYFDFRYATCNGSDIRVSTLMSAGETGMQIQARLDSIGFTHLLFYDMWSINYVYATNYPDGEFRFSPVYDTWMDQKNLVFLLDGDDQPHCLILQSCTLVDRAWNGNEWTERTMIETDDSATINAASGMISDQNNWEIGYQASIRDPDSGNERIVIRVVRSREGILDEQEIDLYPDCSQSNRTALLKTDTGYVLLLVTPVDVIIWNRSGITWNTTRIPLDSSCCYSIKAFWSGSSVLIFRPACNDLIEIQGDTIIRTETYPDLEILDYQLDRERNETMLLYDDSEKDLWLGIRKSGQWQFLHILPAPALEITSGNLEFDTDNQPIMWVTSYQKVFIISRKLPQWQYERVMIPDIDRMSDLEEFEISDANRIAVAGISDDVILCEKTTRGWMVVHNSQIDPYSYYGLRLHELIPNSENRWSLLATAAKNSVVSAMRVLHYDGCSFEVDASFSDCVGETRDLLFCQMIAPDQDLTVVSCTIDKGACALAFGQPRKPDLKFHLPDPFLSPGDPFRLDLEVMNDQSSATYHYLILLEVPVADASLFYSWPDWSPIQNKTTFGSVQLEPGQNVRWTILDFIWPDNVPDLEDGVFYAMLFTDDFSAAASDLARIYFSAIPTSEP